MTIPADKLQEILDGAAKATPGPWSVPHFAQPDINCACGYVLTEGHMGAVATRMAVDRVAPMAVEVGLRAWLSWQADAPVAGHAQLPRIEAAIIAALEAHALGLKQWVGHDGSETWDGDVSATLMGILYDAKVLDPENNDRLASPDASNLAAGVKPLEWEKHPTADLWRAYGLLGPVSIYAVISQISWAFDGFDGITKARGDAGSVDEAKTAAQADYAKRILSALSAPPQPSSPVGRDAEAAWQELIEKDDRTSPEEYPDMALITHAELAEFMSLATPQSQSSRDDVIGALRDIDNRATIPHADAMVGAFNGDDLRTDLRWIADRARAAIRSLKEGEAK